MQYGQPQPASHCHRSRGFQSPNRNLWLILLNCLYISADVRPAADDAARASRPKLRWRRRRLLRNVLQGVLWLLRGDVPL